MWNIYAVLLLLNKTYCLGLAALSLTDLGFCAALNAPCWKQANRTESANITHSCPPLVTPYHSTFLRATSPQYMLHWPFAVVGQRYTPRFIEVDSKPFLSLLAICTTWSKSIVWWPAMIGSCCRPLAAFLGILERSSVHLIFPDWSVEMLSLTFRGDRTAGRESESAALMELGARYRALPRLHFEGLDHQGCA